MPASTDKKPAFGQVWRYTDSSGRKWRVITVAQIEPAGWRVVHIDIGCTLGDMYGFPTGEDRGIDGWERIA